VRASDPCVGWILRDTVFPCDHVRLGEQLRIHVARDDELVQRACAVRRGLWTFGGASPPCGASPWLTLGLQTDASSVSAGDSALGEEMYVCQLEVVWSGCMADNGHCEVQSRRHL